MGYKKIEVVYEFIKLMNNLYLHILDTMQLYHVTLSTALVFCLMLITR